MNGLGLKTQQTVKSQRSKSRNKGFDDSQYANNTTDDDVRILCHAISIDDELVYLKIVKRFKYKYKN